MSLFSLFYPRTCPCCGSYTGEQAMRGQLCDSCLSSLPRTEQVAVPQNGTEMAIGAGTDQRKILHLDHGAAFLFYEKDHPIREMVHAMKYRSYPEIGRFLGRQAAIEFGGTEFFDDIDLIIPVPLHPLRMRSRGYNQSEYIAQGISEITGLPVDTTHVIRTKNTPKQALQRGEERKANVAEAFEVNHPEQLYHKHILLVDDLVTTGETMKACMRAMRLFRGAKISVFALCKAQ